MLVPEFGAEIGGVNVYKFLLRGKKYDVHIVL